MNLSREDMFCEALQPEGTTAKYTDTLDFHNHGDDILGKLFWSLFVAAASTGASLTVAWQTRDEPFADDADTGATTLFSSTIAAASLTAGAYPIKNEALPKGLKRYNRLKLTCGSGTTNPKVTAFLHDGRDEGTPFKGL